MNKREKLTTIVEAMLDSGLFKFQRMRVIDYNLISTGSFEKDKIASFEASQSSPIPTLSKWIESFTKQGILFDIVFLVERFLHMEEETVNREVHLYSFDEFPEYSRIHPTGLAYDSHSSKLYSSISNPSDYYENILLLLDELEIFINFGVQTIRGIGNEQDTDILNHRLCYHQDISNFLTDLNQIDLDVSSIKSLTENNFLDVISKCGNVNSKKILDGFVVWSKKGTDRSISDFYQTLLAWIKEQNNKNA